MSTVEALWASAAGGGSCRGSGGGCGGSTEGAIALNYPYLPPGQCPWKRCPRSSTAAAGLFSINGSRHIAICNRQRLVGAHDERRRGIERGGAAQAGGPATTARGQVRGDLSVRFRRAAGGCKAPCIQAVHPPQQRAVR